MQEVILVIHLILAVSIIAVVLIQPAEAGGFVGNANANMMTPRRSGDLLTRVTGILAGCFFATSLLLAISAGHQPAAKSILDLATDKPAAGKQAESQPAKPETPKAPISK